MTEVTLIGMGASAATLTQEGYAALRAARRVAGARRLLDALPPAVTADRVPAVRCADVLAALQGAEAAHGVPADGLAVRVNGWIKNHLDPLYALSFPSSGRLKHGRQ